MGVFSALEEVLRTVKKNEILTIITRGITRGEEEGKFWYVCTYPNQSIQFASVKTHLGWHIPLAGLDEGLVCILQAEGTVLYQNDAVKVRYKHPPLVHPEESSKLIAKGRVYRREPAPLIANEEIKESPHVMEF